MTANRSISLGRVTALLLFGRMLSHVFILTNSIITARVLGVEQLGSYAYAMGIAGLFGLLPNLGISTVITRTIARDPEGSAGIVRTGLLGQCVLAIGVCVVILCVAAFLPEKPVPYFYLGLAAVQLGLGSLSWPYLAVLSGRAQYDLVAKSELIAAALSSCCVLTAVAFGGGVENLLLSHVVASSLAALVARHIATPFLPTGAQGAHCFLPLLRQAIPFGVTAAIQSLYARIDLIILGQLSGTAAVGLYSAAYKPVTLATYLSGTIAGALFPLMAVPSVAVPFAFTRVVRGFLAAGPAMALALTGLATPLLHMLFGIDFIQAAPILAVLAWSAAANWLYAPFSVAFQARDQERWWLLALCVGFLVNLFGNIFAIQKWGSLGAASATLMSEIVLLVLAVWFATRVHVGLLPPLRYWVFNILAAMGGAWMLWEMHPKGAMAATGSALLLYGGLLMWARSITIDDASAVADWVRQAVWGRHAPDRV